MMLELNNLRISHGSTQLLTPLSLSIKPGQRLGLIGESGSGKSLTALAIMGLLPPTLSAEGSITLNGRELIGLRDREIRPLRATAMAMVFQEPISALDPLMTVARQLAYAGATPEALTHVGLTTELAARYPHELSGGQRQRVMIAMAMARNPELLICDEPTTALDATTEDEILTLIKKVAKKHNTSLLFISHDLRVVARMCTDVVVMNRGISVEAGPTARVFSRPEHPYTQQLVAASAPKAPAPQRTTGKVAITLNHVTKSFRGVNVLSDVCLNIARGGRLGLVGGSGSGKTTLLKLIAGLDKPTSGTVEVTGRVQVVFQDPHGSLDPRLPVWKSVAEGKRGTSKAEALAALAEVGIGSGGDKFPHEFSGGQRQRISIARALIGSPDILLADEAVSALDVCVRAQILDLLARLVDARGLTLVFVTHDLSVMRHLCPTMAVLHKGTIVEHGKTESIWAHPRNNYTANLVRNATTSKDYTTST